MIFGIYINVAKNKQTNKQTNNTDKINLIVVDQINKSIDTQVSQKLFTIFINTTKYKYDFCSETKYVLLGFFKHYQGVVML